MIFIYNYNRNCNSKTGSRPQIKKKNEIYFKKKSKRKMISAKIGKSADKALSQS